MAAITAPAANGYVLRGIDISGTAADDNLKDFQLEIAAGNQASATHWSSLGAGSAVVRDGVLLKWQALPVDGVHTLKLTVTDKAGNSTETLSEVTVDTKAPATPAELVAVLESGVNARLSWTANKEADLVGYAVFRNGSRITPLLQTETTYLDPALALGHYQYTVKAFDKAGWESQASAPAAVSVSQGGVSAQLYSPGRASFASAVVDIKGTASASGNFKEYRLYIGAGASPASWQLLRRSPVPIIADLLGTINTLGLQDYSLQTLNSTRPRTCRAR